jgi:hypothetical protein
MTWRSLGESRLLQYDRLAADPDVEVVVSLSSGRLSDANITLLNYYTFEAKAFKIIDTVILILELRCALLTSNG